jgi:hypothetical protein
MSDKPKPPWFRFHISTAILMMLVAGTVTFANSRMGWLDQLGWRWPCRGWPIVFWIGNLEFSVRPDQGWSCSGLLADIAVGVLIVFGSAFASEYLLRCREGRKL